ncbi:hypothetical protein P3786_24690 [Pseudomonas aeruginosa]|nr:hypothetical protein [Pseudomonas aeruginosa]
MEQAMREEFEAWVTKAMGGYADLRKSNDPNFDYEDVDVDFAYQAWKASRAALRVEDEINRLKAEIDQCASTLPATYYMDPPDGGNVSIPEQIRRMAKDAARYRWLRGASHFDTPQHQAFCKAYGDALDYEIDAVIEGAKQ